MNYLNEMQSNFLQDYQEEGCGIVQPRSILSNIVELCILGILWNAFCAPKQPFGRHHQWCWTCFRDFLSYHLFYLFQEFQEERKGAYAFECSVFSFDHLISS
jgi:hypothetical protein